jgi:hypothetical protein
MWIAVSGSVMQRSIHPLHYEITSNNATHVPEGFGPQRIRIRNLKSYIIFVFVIQWGLGLRTPLFTNKFSEQKSLG